MAVQNTGNVDAGGVDLRIQFPNYFEWQLLDAKATDIFTGGNSTSINVQLASVPAGSSQPISLRVKSSDDPKYAHVDFSIAARASLSQKTKAVYVGDLMEPHILRLKTADKTALDYFSDLDAHGNPEGLNTMRVTSPDGDVTSISLNKYEMPVQIINSNGDKLLFKYVSPTEIKITAHNGLGIQGGGNQDITVDLSSLDQIPAYEWVHPSEPFNPCAAYQTCIFFQFLRNLLCGDFAKVGAGATTVAGVWYPKYTNQIMKALQTATGKAKFAKMASLAGFAYIIICTDWFKNHLDALCDSYYKECGKVTVSHDPNDIAGAIGFDTPQWISESQPLPYTVFFANKRNATAPAQVVRVTDQLDFPGADLSTLSLGTITIGAQTVTPEAHINPIEGVREFDADADLRPTKNLLVHVNAKLNLDNGLLTWTFTSIDPVTGLPLAPDDPNGFLDPGQEGSMLFTVMPRKNQKTGTVIRNQASIVFDANAAMLTPIWFNTIDNDKPISTVNALPATESSTDFTVTWQGTDVGSGVRDYTIYVSDNGGAWTPWLTNTMDTSATFTGVGGHTYAFYSQARDNVFNVGKLAHSSGHQHQRHWPPLRMLAVR